MMHHNKSYSNLNIILVEDSEISHLVALTLLESMGLNVHSAYNGSECLSILSNNDPDYFDLIIMDLQMPIMDGITTVEQIRSNKIYDKIKIIILSADAIEKSNINYIELGIHSYIKKPLNKTSVVEVIDELFYEEQDNQHIEPNEKKPVDIENPLLDFNNTLSRLGNNRSLYKDLINTFVKKYSLFVNELSVLFESEDFEAIKLKIHSLKGDSRNIGALKLCSEVEVFESLFIQNPFKPNIVDLGSIEFELLNIVNNLKEIDEVLLIDQSDDNQITPSHIINFETFILELIELLDNCNYEAKLYVKQASNYKSEKNKNLIEKLESEVNDFNYEEGLVTANALKSEYIS
ncbi:MAG: response regulator [Candidatus Kapaibacterium sp.]